MMVKIVKAKKIIAKGKGKISRKALNLSILSFIIGSAMAVIMFTVPTITLPTWLVMAPPALGFALLMYDSLK